MNAYLDHLIVLGLWTLGLWALSFLGVHYLVPGAEFMPVAWLIASIFTTVVLGTLQGWILPTLTFVAIGGLLCLTQL